MHYFFNCQAYFTQLPSIFRTTLKRRLGEIWVLQGVLGHGWLFDKKKKKNYGFQGLK